MLARSFLLCSMLASLSMMVHSSFTCETIYLLHLAPYPDSSPFAGWDKGFELIPAGHLATKHINNRTDILNGYKLEVVDVPSEACGRVLVVDSVLNLYTEMLNTRCLYGVIGLHCSLVTERIAPMMSHPNYGYIQLATSTSPMHRDTTNFPYLFHTISSSSVFNKAVISLMEIFNWTQISVVFDSETFYHKTTGFDFKTLIYTEANKTLISGTPIQVKEYEENMHDRTASRIEYYSVTDEESALIMCNAFHKNLLWPSYVHIFHERSLFLELYEYTTCTREQMFKAIENVYTLQYRLKQDDNMELISKLSYRNYYSEYMAALKNFEDEKRMPLDSTEYANSLYDQVWSFALSMNRSLDNTSLVNDSFGIDTLESATEFRDILSESLRELPPFSGASGKIHYGDRQEVETFVDIFQYINGRKVHIGMYDPNNNDINFFEMFDEDSIPGDTFRTEHLLMPTWLGVLVIFSQTVVLIMVILNIVAVFYWRNKPEIKSSCVYINLVMLFGCFLLSLSPICLTVYAATNINASVYSVLCTTELWLFMNGINIIFVALLFRLTRIFHVFRSFRSTGKYWSDKYLLLYIATVSLILVTLLTIWTVVDPGYQVTQEVFVTSSQPPYRSIRSYCSSSKANLWISISYFFIGLVLLLVLFLAIQTRHIKRKHFKDTKKVNVFVFSVCITLALLVPLSEILFAVDMIVVAHVCKWLALFMIALLCQLLLFFPKIIPILGKKKTSFTTQTDTQIYRSMFTSQLSIKSTNA